MSILGRCRAAWVAWWERGGLCSDLWLLGALAAAVIFPALGQTQYLAPRELRHCEIAREMSVTHDYIVPRLLGEVYHDKPPVMHALAAVIMQWWGAPTVFIGRLPSAMAGLGVVLMTYGLGRVLTGRKLALVAAASLLAMPGFVIMSRQARPDMILGFAIVTCCLALALGMRSSRRGARAGWFALAGLAAGLGVVTKGPYGLLFPLFFAVLAPWRRADWRRPRWGWLGFALALLATACLWAVPAYLRDGGKFLHAVIVQRDLDVTQHASSWYLLVAPSIFLTLPLSAFLPMAIRDWRRHGYSAPLACAAAMYLTIQAIPKKRAHYLVPIYPFLALGLAATLLRLAATSARMRRVVVGSICLGAAIVPLYFGVVVRWVEYPEESDLQIARAILQETNPAQPILAAIALAEPLAWVGRNHERVQELDAEDPAFATKWREVPPGTYVVLVSEQVATLPPLPDGRALETVKIIEWSRHKLDVILNFRQRPVRNVSVLQVVAAAGNGKAP